MSPGTLFVIATPIGNLEDITFRAVRILGDSALILAEDTRRTRKLLSRYEISTPLISCNARNAGSKITKTVRLLKEGKDISLVTDAGTPAVSDPGNVIVNAVADEGGRVCPVPGPSAAISALSICGLKGEGFRFVGFLPKQKNRRHRRLGALAEDGAVLIFYEAPGRLRRMLVEFRDFFGSERMAVICRELTKIHEDITRGSLGVICEDIAEDIKGEVTVLIEGSPAASKAGPEIDDGVLDDLILKEIHTDASLRDIALRLSRRLELPRKTVYDRAVRIINQEKGS